MKFFWLNSKEGDKEKCRMYGRCRKCGRKLTDPTSRRRGFGPDCWAEIGGCAEFQEGSGEDAPLPGQINLFDYMENTMKGDTER